MRPELAALDRRFMLVEQPVELPMGRVLLEKPRNADDLISEADFAKDDRLPYWADLWPAAIVLAQFLEQRALNERASGTARQGTRALELGCGLGLVTTAATRAGYDVLATDYYEDATLLAALASVAVTCPRRSGDVPRARRWERWTPTRVPRRWSSSPSPPTPGCCPDWRRWSRTSPHRSTGRRWARADPI